jgi:hypothetical protein
MPFLMELSPRALLLQIAVIIFCYFPCTSSCVVDPVSSVSESANSFRLNLICVYCGQLSCGLRKAGSLAIPT